MNVKEIQKKLFSMADEGYRDFSAALMPTVDKEAVIGVRTPELRRLAKELYRAGNVSEFLSVLPHRYYEENNLHAYIIEQIPDFGECICALDAFLPYVNNWATCDTLRPVCFKKHKEELSAKIDGWMRSSDTYTVRFGIEMLMVHFLDTDFSPDQLRRVASVRSDEYYVNMMIAWYFATALAKQWNDAVKYIENASLSPWVHNKAIQKSRESYRLTAEQKEYLKELKR